MSRRAFGFGILIVLVYFVVIYSMLVTMNESRKGNEEKKKEKEKERIVRIDEDYDVRCLERGIEITCPFFSQSSEDLIILKHMMERFGLESGTDAVEFPFLGKEFTVVEIGGFDGITYSNSFFFEAFLGWNAVLFEASKANFEKLYRNRPFAIKRHVAVCDSQRTVHFVENKLGEVSGILEEMSEAFRNYWHGGNHEEQVYEVSCGPLNYFFEEMGLRYIDIFFLDIEGGEFSALQNLDFKRFLIHYLIIEMDGSNKTRDFMIEDLLIKEGFVRIPFEDRNGAFELQSWRT